MKSSSNCTCHMLPLCAVLSLSSTGFLFVQEETERLFVDPFLSRWLEAHPACRQQAGNAVGACIRKGVTSVLVVLL